MSQFSTFAFSRIGCNWQSDISDAVVVFFFFYSATISNVIISILTL